MLNCFLNGMVQATGIKYEKLYVLNMYNELYTFMDQTDYVPDRELLVRNFGVVQLINGTPGAEHTGTGYFAVGQHQIAVTVVVFLQKKTQQRNVQFITLPGMMGPYDLFFHIEIPGETTFSVADVIGADLPVNGSSEGTITT